MGYLLTPINYSLGLAHDMGGDLGEAVQKIRQFFNQIRTFVTSIVESIFGVFLNILIQFQHVTIKIKDIIAKMVGISATFLYLIDGATKTGESIWRGPVGGTLRTVCFKPSTVLNLKKGEKKEMKNIKLGDVLENGSKVTGIVSLSNPFKENGL